MRGTPSAPDVVERGREQRGRDLGAEHLNDQSGAIRFVTAKSLGGAIRKSFTFEAAHVLPRTIPEVLAASRALPIGSTPRSRGRSRKPVRRRGWSRTSRWSRGSSRAAVVAEFDHRSLNDLMDNPTAERIAAWIWRRLAPQLPALAELTWWETPRACVVMKKDDPLTRAG